MYTKKNPGHGVLHNLYVSQGLSIAEIASRLGVTYPAVHKWLKAAGIPRRRRGRPAGVPVSPEHLAKLRINAAKAARAVTPEGRKRGALKRRGLEPPNKGKSWTPAQREKLMAIRRTPEHRAKLAAAKLGEKNGMWNGGTDRTPNELRTNEWKRRRRECYERDNWSCVDCGVKCGSKGNRRIQCHHVIPRRLGGGDELENLVTLCVACHVKREREGRDALFA